MLTLLSHEDARRLRDFFSEAGYTAEQFRDGFAFTSLPSRRFRSLPRMLDQTREPSALNVLARWFFIGVPVDQATCKEVIPQWLISAALQCGLLQAEGNSLLGKARIAPLDQMLIASDQALCIENEEHSDLVLWPNPTTRLLSHATIRKPSRATLDFGGGTGVQSLWAAAHSETVVATDLNERATEFSAFNARLNGFDNIECLTGDSFAPVEGRTFDLILANPPFFITPSQGYMYCNSNMDLDQFCRHVAREAPSFLNEGGFFQMLCEWVEIPGQSWQERLTEWVEGSGCDVLILRGNSSEPSIYAQDRFRETVPYNPETDSDTYAAWMAYYRERQIQAIHGGVISMRKRSGTNWLRFDEVPGGSIRPFGDAVLRLFENQDYLLSRDDAALSESKLVLSPHAHLEQHFVRSGAEWNRNALGLRIAQGLTYSQSVEPLVLEFLSGCDGTRRLKELIGELAGKVQASSEQVERECLEVTRRLMARGFLLPG